MSIASKRFTWKSIHHNILVSLPRLRLLIILFLVLPIFFGSSSALSQANTEGVVYVINQYQAPPSRVFTIRIQIASAEPFNGWNIQIQANQSIINPISASIAGNTLDANYTENLKETVNCVNGVNLTASHCDNSDGPGIVHSAAIALRTNPPTGSVVGLLLTINYTVVLAGLYSPLHFLRTTISNGVTPISVQVLDGFYGIPLEQDFGVNASQTTERILIGSKANITLTVYTSGGYSGRVDLVSETSDPSLVANLNQTYTQAYAYSPKEVTITVTTNTALQPSQYEINVTATSSGRSHSIIIKVTTTDTPDFTLEASPPTLRITPNAAGNSTVRLETRTGFSGSVDLHLDLPPVLGLTASLTPSVVTISSSGSSTAALNVHAPDSIVPFLYLINITASSASSSSVSTLTVLVQPPDPDFTVSIQTPEFELKAGQSIASVLTMTSIDFFRGRVHLVSSTVVGTEEEFNPPNVSLGFGNSSKSIVTFTANQNFPSGSYDIRLGAIGTTDSGANVTHIIVVRVTVNRPVTLSAFFTPEGVAYLGLVSAFLLVLVAASMRMAKWRKVHHIRKSRMYGHATPDIGKKNGL